MCESFLPLKSYRIRAFAHETCIHVYPGYPGYPSGKFPQSTDSQLNFKHIDSNYNLLSPKVEHNFLSLSDSSSISFILLRQLFHLSTQVKYILLIKTNALNLTMKGSEFLSRLLSYRRHIGQELDPGNKAGMVYAPQGLWIFPSTDAKRDVIVFFGGCISNFLLAITF